MSGSECGEGSAPVLRLDGFEGPLDLLLELARAQRVDLAGLSILAIVEQFLAAVDGARALRLELAADWLVMAAWLAWLKSRLLLPADTAEAAEAQDAAAGLAVRIAGLAQVRGTSTWLGARPQLGIDVFCRGAPEDLVREDRSRLSSDLPGLVRGYLDGVRRAGAREAYRRPEELPGLGEALARLSRLLGGLAGWTELRHLLPDGAAGLRRRAGVASTLLAGLELARGGEVLLRQDEAFGPILLRRADARAMAAE